MLLTRGTDGRAAVCKTRKKRKRKKKKGQQLPLLGFLSSYETKSLFLLFNAERNSEVVAFHIRTSAGRARIPSAPGMQRNGATQPPRSHRASHRDLQEEKKQAVIKAGVFSFSE